MPMPGDRSEIDLEYWNIVKLRSRSRSGEGQVRVRKVRKVRFGPELYNIFGFHHHHHHHPPGTFFWL